MDRPAPLWTPTRLAAGALVGVVVILAALLLVFRPSRDAEAPPDRSPAPVPSPSPDRGVQPYLDRLRNSLGADAAAAEALRARMPTERGALGAFLVRIRVELDLAIRSTNPDSGVAALDLVARALRSGGAEVRRVVESAAYDSMISGGLASGFPPVRAAAAAALGEVGTDAARARLVPVLGDASEVVRVAAVRAYGGLAAAGGARRLAVLYRSEKSPAVRTEILRVFTEHPPLMVPDAARVVASALAAGTEAERLQALAAVRLYRDRSCVPGVLALLSSGSREVRRAALDALLTIRDARAKEPVAKVAESDEDPDLRALAEKVLEALR